MCLVCLRKLFQHCFSVLWHCSSVSLKVCSAERMKITHTENREFPFLHSARAERCLHLCPPPYRGQFVCKLGQSGPATQDQAQLCRMIPYSPALLSRSRAASGCLLWKQTNTFTVSAYSLVKSCVWAWCLCCSYHHLLSTKGMTEAKSLFLPVVDIAQAWKLLTASVILLQPMQGSPRSRICTPVSAADKNG